MRVLLDSHVLLWWLFDEPRLSKDAVERIRDPENQILVSAATAWEIATKYRLGRLPDAQELVSDFSGCLLKARFQELAVTVSHSVRAGSWQVEHRDPFDRMLAAQAEIEGVPLITKDPALRVFGIPTHW